MITLSSITAGYPSSPAVLRNLSFSFPDHGIYTLMGASGIGKTTLLRVMAGLTPPASGTIDGLAGRRVIMLFQEDRLLPWCTVIENVQLGMETPDQGKAMEILRMLDIADSCDHKPGELSGGMQRRVALARAIGYGADVLLMDEPFAGIDAHMIVQIAAHVQRAASFILFTSHVESDACAMNADIVSLIDGSTLTARGRTQPGNPIFASENRV